MNKNDVVQFNERHEWCGSLGIVEKVKQCGKDIKYLVGVPIPLKGTAYIFAMDSDKVIERVGEAIFINSDSEVEE